MTVLAVLCVLAASPQLPLSIATTDDALAVFANPAGLGAGRGSDLYAFYNFRPVSWGDAPGNLTFAANAGPLGAFWDVGARRYGLALGAGGRGAMAGIRFTRDAASRWDAGLMARPWSWLSLGAVWDDLGHDWGTVRLGAAVRPVGSRLTFNGDILLVRPLAGEVGLEAEPIDGVALALRVAPGEDARSTGFSAGLTVGLGRTGIGAVFTRSNGSEAAGFIRVGSEARRTILPRGRSYLHVELKERLVEQKPGLSLSGGPSRTTWSLLDMLRRAAEDKSVRALLLEMGDAGMSLAQAQEVRQAVLDLRARGKRVYVYAASLGMGSYYVASAADRIICHPMGGVEIPGAAAGMLFLKGTVEKLGITPEATRHGRYKSAVEMFTEDSLTGPNREQLQALVDGAWDEFVSGVSSGRRLGRDSVERLVDVGWFRADEARAAGLVDTFCYRDELDTLLRKDLRRFHELPEAGFPAGRGFDYDWQDRPAVAIIYAVGEIGDGESGTDFLSGTVRMGAQTMVRAIRAAAAEKRVRAIVLRIDSPGGDGYASDLIWHELDKIRTKKPVIVSMGGLAASGGYYIAMNSKRIFASPGTITGSIGVFDLRFVTEGLYNKLGAKHQFVKRGRHADALSGTREMTPEEDSMVQAQADHFYDQFVRKVAQGRRLSYEHVDSVGQGRVWSGRDARAIGLVDSLGGFMQAVDWAKKEARLGDCDFIFYPQPGGGFLERLGQAMEERVLRVVLP